MHEYEMGYDRDVPSLRHEMLAVHEMGKYCFIWGLCGLLNVSACSFALCN